MKNNTVIYMLVLLSTFLHSMQDAPTSENAALLSQKTPPVLTQTNPYHQSPIVGLSFLPYENILVAASLIKQVAIMDANTNKTVQTIFSPPKRYSKYYHRWLHSLTLSSEGTMCATGFSDGDIEIHETKTGNPIKEFKDYDGITSLAFSPNQSKLYAASASANKVSIWDLSCNKRLRTIPLKTSFFTDNTHISVSDEYLATSDGDACLYKLNSSETEPLRKLIPSLNSSRFVEFAPDMKSLIIAASSLKVSKNIMYYLLSMDDSFPVQQLKDVSSRAIHRTSGISFQPNSSTMATSSIAGTVRLWDRDTSDLIQKWKAHTSRTHTSFSPYGSILATGAGGGTIKFWKQPEE